MYAIYVWHTSLYIYTFVNGIPVYSLYTGNVHKCIIGSNGTVDLKPVSGFPFRTYLLMQRQANVVWHSDPTAPYRQSAVALAREIQLALVVDSL